MSKYINYSEPHIAVHDDFEKLPVESLLRAAMVDEIMKLSIENRHRERRLIMDFILECYKTIAEHESSNVQQLGQ